MNNVLFLSCWSVFFRDRTRTHGRCRQRRRKSFGVHRAGKMLRMNFIKALKVFLLVDVSKVLKKFWWQLYIDFQLRHVHNMSVGLLKAFTEVSHRKFSWAFVVSKLTEKKSLEYPEASKIPPGDLVKNSFPSVLLFYAFFSRMNHSSVTCFIFCLFIVRRLGLKSDNYH